MNTSERGTAIVKLTRSNDKVKRKLENAGLKCEWEEFGIMGGNLEEAEVRGIHSLWKGNIRKIVEHLPIKRMSDITKEDGDIHLDWDFETVIEWDSQSSKGLANIKLYSYLPNSA